MESARAGAWEGEGPGAGTGGAPAGRWRWALVGVVMVPVVLGVHEGSMLRMRPAATEASVAAFAEVERLVRQEWVEAPDVDALRDGALTGLVSTLDEFSVYVPPSELARFAEETTGQFGGLGIYVALEDGLVRVIAPIEDTPAWRAGILPGDTILRIDGREYQFQSADDAVRALKGPPGSTIELLVLHPGEGQRPFSVTLERAVIQLRSVKGARLIDPAERVGYVRVTSFVTGTVDELDRALGELEAAGARALVLDLRGNPGGYLGGAVDVADRFLPEGAVIVQTRGRVPGSSEETRAAAPARVTLPLAVLIDGGSASASEILAGALRDHGRATLVGARSFGKGSVQGLYSVLGGAAQLKLTTQHYLTPKGRRIHRGDRPADDDSWGLLPDLPVPLDPQARAKLAAAEAELDLERLKARADGQGGADGANGAAAPPEDRLRLDDPQVAAAHAHLLDVLAGRAALGAPAR